VKHFHGASRGRERLLRARRWEGLIDQRQFGCAESQLRRVQILLDALRLHRLRYRHHIGLPKRPGERDLRGAEASLAADSLQYRMSGKRTLSQRRVGHCLDAPLALPGQQRKLNGARPEAVVDLIALRRGFKRQRLLDIKPLRELVQVQIADPEMANEPTLAQIIETAQARMVPSREA
jgi:hypothetical protein